MLNADVHENYTNHQCARRLPSSAHARIAHRAHVRRRPLAACRYQDRVAAGGSAAPFTIRSECSIFFELDGPYRAMVIPASTEEVRARCASARGRPRAALMPRRRRRTCALAAGPPPPEALRRL